MQLGAASVVLYVLNEGLIRVRTSSDFKCGSGNFGGVVFCGSV